VNSTDISFTTEQKHRPTVHVLHVIDQSGSMNAVAGDVRGGFNAAIDDLRDPPTDEPLPPAGTAAASSGLADLPRFRVTVTLFNDRVTELCTDVRPVDVPVLTRTNYLAGGNTALLDAVGHTIRRFEERVTLHDGDKVLIVIHTDGKENASTRYSWDEVVDTIDARSMTGRWEFLYIGAGPDAWEQARRFGHNTYSVDTGDTSQGTRAAYAGATGATIAYARGVSGQGLAEVARSVVDQYDAPDPTTPA
jgi:hypothetical protein